MTESLSSIAQSEASNKNKPTAGRTLTHSEATAILDSEIERITDETRRPGWSKWALQGGIATLIWLGLSEINSKSNLITIAIVFLSGTFITDFIFSFCKYFNGFGVQKKEQKRYRFLRDDPNANPSLVIFFAVKLAILFVVYTSVRDEFWIPTLSIYYGGFILLSLLIIPLRLVKAFPKKDLPKNHVHYISWVAISWSSFISYAIFQKLPSLVQNVSDYRVGLLCVGIFYLSELIISGETDQPAIQRLKDIRRELAFGRLSPENAMNDADITLSGYTASMMTEYEFDRISDAFEEAIHGYEKLTANCQSVNGILNFLEAENRHGIKWKEEAQKAALLIDTCVTFRNKNQNQYLDTFLEAKKFLKAMDSGHFVWSKKLEAKWPEFRNKLDQAFKLQNATNNLLNDTIKRYNEISEFADGEE